MKNKYIPLTLLATLLSTSILVSCGSSSDLLKMLENNECIEIIVAEPDYAEEEQGTQKQLDWEPLAYRDSNLEFRTWFDTMLGIQTYGEGKNGIVYIDENGNHTDNSTLYHAFMNEKFIDKVWSESEESKLILLTSRIGNTYSDIEISESGITEEQKAGVLNAYFNIFADQNPHYFNGNTTLTRNEFMTGAYKSSNPVDSDLEISDYILDNFGDEENALFISEMMKYSFINDTDKSLTSTNLNGTITRAEAVYIMVNQYFADELENTSSLETSFSDMKNKGAVEIESDEYKNARILAESLENPEDGLPEELYKAMLVAEKHGLLDGMIIDNESAWDIGLTKLEGIQLIVNTYKAVAEKHGYLVSAETGVVRYDENNLQALYERLDTPTHTELDQNLGIYKLDWDWEDTVKSVGDKYLKGATESETDKFMQTLANMQLSGKEVYDYLQNLNETELLHVEKEEVDIEETVDNSDNNKPQNNTDNSKPQNNTDGGGNQDVVNDGPGNYDHTPGKALGGNLEGGDIDMDAFNDPANQIELDPDIEVMGG